MQTSGADLANKKGNAEQIDAPKALAIALAAIREQRQLNERQCKCVVNPDDEGWFITISLIPPTPGAIDLVSVDKSGRARVSGLY